MSEENNEELLAQKREERTAHLKRLAAAMDDIQARMLDVFHAALKDDFNEAAFLLEDCKRLFGAASEECTLIAMVEAAIRRAGGSYPAAILVQSGDPYLLYNNGA